MPYLVKCGGCGATIRETHVLLESYAGGTCDFCRHARGGVAVPPTVQAALSALLGALGFAAMARDVRTETDAARLAHYARIVLKQTHEPEMRRSLVTRFRALGLVA